MPPHILRNIALNGDDDQRRAAHATLAVDSTFRALRSRLVGDLPLETRRAHALDTGMGLRRTISDAGGAETLPGAVVRAEGGPAVADPAVNEAYDGLGHTFEFFLKNYRRNSIDDAGMPLEATVHFGAGYDNAFWNGQRMVFGDGDGRLFNRFTLSLDVIGHELGHGVTGDETGLVYMLQPGALNEHLSDVWGSLIKQWFNNQTADDADWLIGAELLAPGVAGQALRSMKAPGTAYNDRVLGKDPQPDHMSRYVSTWDDNGGVHINSGIPNKAFFLAASAIGGYAWQKAGLVWYEAIRDSRVTEHTDFAGFAAVTIDQAGKIPGGSRALAKAVSDAWKAVGVV